MTVETPSAGSPSLAAYGRGGDVGPECVGSAGVAPTPEAGGRVDPACRALHGLAAELRSRGVEVREDGVFGSVDAGPASRPQRALLRPHRGGLWWWMRWPLQEGVSSALAGVPLSPVTCTSEAARRIAGALAASVGEP